MARTDARSAEDLDSAISRARRYVEAGADWIFPEALATTDEFERFAREIEVPLMANMTEVGKSPLLTLDDLAGQLVIRPLDDVLGALDIADALVPVFTPPESTEQAIATVADLLEATA